MNKGIKKNKSITKENLKKFVEAQKSYKKMKKEIEPFVKSRRIETFPSIGEWRESSNLCFDSE